jgi:hypothetical protein
MVAGALGSAAPDCHYGAGALPQEPRGVGIVGSCMLLRLRCKSMPPSPEDLRARVAHDRFEHLGIALDS